MTLFSIAIGIAALGCGIIGGLFFAFSTFIMRALADQPAPEGMAAMVAINRVILRSLFMPVFFGTAILAAVLALYAVVVWVSRSWWMVTAAAAYVLGTVGLTMWKNVPLNNAIDRADPAADNGVLWRHYLDRWTWWNSVRTIASLVASGLFMGALVV